MKNASGLLAQNPLRYQESDMYLKNSGRMGGENARSILSESMAKYRNVAFRQVMKQNERRRSLWEESIYEWLCAAAELFPACGAMN